MTEAGGSGPRRGSGQRSGAEAQDFELVTYGPRERAAAEVQGSLGLPSRHDADAFLKEAGADIGYRWQDLEDDLRTFARASRR